MRCLTGSRGVTFCARHGNACVATRELPALTAYRIWTATCAHRGRLVRYADDFVILCRTPAQAEQALAKVREIMGLLRWQLHPTKTRLVELGLGKEGFTFLGCYLRIVRSRFKRRAYLFRWPSPRAMQAIRSRIHDLTTLRHSAGLNDIRVVIGKLNPVARHDTISRRRACPLRRPSVSRLREIRTSGLKGDLRKRSRRATAPEVYQCIWTWRVSGSWGGRCLRQSRSGW